MIAVHISLPGESYRVEIQNDRTGTEEVGNYNVQLIGPIQRYGKTRTQRIHVRGFERSRRFEGLLAEVFAELERLREEAKPCDLRGP